MDITEANAFLKVMQETFEQQTGSQRTFRITATPVILGKVLANLEDNQLLGLLRNPPQARPSGWTVKPLGPLSRNALGFENDRTDYHHLKFVKNGHLEFWTEIDESFCWQQSAEEMKRRPRLYPYAVVEYPVSFARLYRQLISVIGITGDIVFQMQYLNIRNAVLFPYQPESVGFNHPIEPVQPLELDRLVFEKKIVPHTFDPDPTALALIRDLYYQFRFDRQHIPFFDETGHCRL